MKSLKGTVAIVAGASRGAGRGIALALGEAGATVYIAGRTIRKGPKPPDGSSETIEDTAEEVTKRGGTGIPVKADCTHEDDVAALFERVTKEQGKLDVLAISVWGGHDAYADEKDFVSAWSKRFWEQPTAHWKYMMGAGPRAYYLTSWHAMQLMAPAKKGLIVGVTDGIMDGVSDAVLEGKELGGFQGQVIYDLSHACINRLMCCMAAEAKKAKVAVVTLMPGFMQTERVMREMTSEKLKKQFGFDKSESVEYIGRAVAALAGDAKVLKKSGRIHFVADLAKEYGFTDIDGRYIPRFGMGG